MVQAGQQDGKRRAGFLARIARDRRGNTLAIVGAALVPLTAMIGSGVDISRAYMAKTRLQSACDAAALAGRRVMTNDQLTPAVTQEAVRFFNFNFNPGLYQTTAFTPVVTKPAVGTIRVTASTNIPTAIMGIFGFSSLPLNVECDASLNYVNTDVMLVLDVTGSMADDVNNAAATAPNRKIDNLRDAVMALYDALSPTQTQLEAAGMRLRYGIVPYSSTVNVGALLRSVNSSYIADTVTVQSRVANYNVVNDYVQTGSSSTQTSETWGSSITSTECNSYGGNRSYTTLDGAGPFAVSGSQASGTMVQRTYSFRDWGAVSDTTGSTRTCRRWRTDTTTTWAPRYRSSGWTLQPVTYDVSQYKLGNAMTVATDNAGLTMTAGSYSPQQMVSAVTGEATTSLTWDGCIQERDTVNTISAGSGFTIPSDAYDLDINLIPNNDATRWRPMIDELSRYRPQYTSTSTTDYGQASGACPYQARRLQAWTRANLQSYVNNLNPVGSTYHDIGMIWGARMLSNAGVFADSPDTYNSMPVSRHIIFMTDGQLAPSATTYSAYGLEYMDQRITGSPDATDQYNRHLQRFRMMCNQAKAMNISVWVIAFGTTLTQDMIDCASNPNQASTSANRQQLIDRFTQIGQNIGALRLTQ